MEEEGRFVPATVKQWPEGFTIGAGGASPGAPRADRHEAALVGREHGGGAAPVRAHIEELLPVVPEGKIEAGRVFDRVLRLDEVPEGYGAMNEREAIEVMSDL